MRSFLLYSVRVRDLVHGYVYLTDLEIRVINHPLFQRLRHIRQNDVAFYVYPSLNTSRFEHSLGCAHVAGKMAANLINSKYWEEYQKEINIDEKDFEQACRLYALLHDIGHLPLSHVFEIAFEDYAESEHPDKLLADLTKEWFGGDGFAKLHEACGNALSKAILDEVPVPDFLKSIVLHLMCQKKLEKDNPRRPIKLLIDSEIDADRIDSTARDGMLAGGEYGNYDIDGLCSAVFIDKNGDTWRLAYSNKALNAIEGLILDRYRTHNWIHFHHRVVAMKAAAGVLIGELLKKNIINKGSFPIQESNEIALCDDVWLWSLLREQTKNMNSTHVKAARKALFYRDKSEMTLLWKNRMEYNSWHNKLWQVTERREGSLKLDPSILGRAYEKSLSEAFGQETLVFWVKFEPLEKGKIPLISESEIRNKRKIQYEDFLDLSPLVSSLKGVWAKEPHYYVILLGKPSEPLDKIRDKWVNLTSQRIEDQGARE